MHLGREASRETILSGSEQTFFVHPTAVVDLPVYIGDGTKVWHFCHLMSGCRIGRDCNIGQNAFIAAGAVLGDNVKVQNNVSIYDGVEIEDDVFLGPSMVFTNVSTPRSAVSRREQYERTLVEKGATIGANATVVCGHTIGAHAFIGAGAVVTKDVVPFALVVGNPARQVGWMCGCGARLPESLVCEACGRRFAVDKSELQEQVP